MSALPERLRRRLQGRVLRVASMHDKHRAIGPAFAHLPLAGVLPADGLDTDQLGTFTGEVARPLPPAATAEQKARLWLTRDPAALVIASEGTFGPHPASPWLACDEEWLVLVDGRDGAVFRHRHVALGPVFGGRQCRDLAAAHEFAAQLRFPSHWLVVRPQQQPVAGAPQWKGLASPAALDLALRAVFAAHGSCWIEADLRAMANPTRLAAIGRAAQEFAAELARSCPQCGAEHFAVAAPLPGLPCELCGTPTPALRAQRRACWACAASAEEPRADGRTAADPAGCPVCNP